MPLALLRILLAVALAACRRSDAEPQPQPQPQPQKQTQTQTPMPTGAPNMETKTIDIAAREKPVSHLVVLLHGVGADAESFQGIAQTLAPSLPHADFVVPDGFHPWEGGGTGRQWFSLRGLDDANRPARTRDAGDEVSRWIDAELKKRGLERDRVALVGFSQGAMLAGWLAIHRNPRPAAAVMLSGRVAEDQQPEAGAAAVPVFVAHGDRDPLIAASVVEPGARTLQAWGARVTTRIYPGLAHHTSPEELSDAAAFLKAALESH